MDEDFTRACITTVLPMRCQNPFKNRHRPALQKDHRTVQLSVRTNAAESEFFIVKHQWPAVAGCERISREGNACAGIAKLSAVIGTPFLAPLECWRWPPQQRQLHVPHGLASLCAEFPSHRHRPSSQIPTNPLPSGYKRGIPVAHVHCDNLDIIATGQVHQEVLYRQILVIGQQFDWPAVFKVDKYCAQRPSQLCLVHPEKTWRAKLFSVALL